MSFKFIGYNDFTSNGKFLWEILCQLRGMGVGRFVTKYEWRTKWPEENSYLRIVGVRPQMDRWLQKGRVWGEWTFRGRNLGVYEFEDNLNRADWILIHKHEEEALFENKKQMPMIEIPKTMPIPPLQKYMNKKWIEKYKVTSLKPKERTELELCIDPQFEILKPFIKRVDPPKEKSNSNSTIYNEMDPKTFLDFYGRMLPVKMDAWSTDPATFENHFGPNK